MRVSLTPLLILVLVTVHGQVTVDVPLSLTGPSEQRFVSGVAVPNDPSAAITVEASLLGTAHWAEASVNGSVITLLPAAPLTSYHDGLLLRFLAPAAVHGPSSLACTGLPALAIVRPDGMEPARGQIRQSAVMEVVLAGGRWILLNAPQRGCPTGTVAIGDALCMEAADAPNSFFYAAADRCAARGGRLCGWDEFYVACTQHAAEMTGLLDAWEWIDDSSNHANSAVQVGLGSCNTQRWANPQNVTYGHSRCCFKPR